MAQRRLNKQKAAQKVNEWVLQSSMEITREWWLSDENDTSPITAEILENYWIETYLDNEGINVGVSTLGSWAVGNLIWFSDALVLGQNIALQPDDLVPDFYV